MDERKTMRPPRRTSYRQLRKAESRRNSFPQQLVKYQMVSALNTSSITQTEYAIFSNIYIYMLVITISEKGHEFEREQGGSYGRVWIEEKEEKKIT